MYKFREVPKNTVLFKDIDSYGNFMSSGGSYYLMKCPSCSHKNPDHAVASGKCIRCGYELSAKDEDQKWMTR